MPEWRAIHRTEREVSLRLAINNAMRAENIASGEENRPEKAQKSILL
jgi:hypothetical protein